MIEVIRESREELSGKYPYLAAHYRDKKVAARLIIRGEHAGAAALELENGNHLFEAGSQSLFDRWMRESQS